MDKTDLIYGTYNLYASNGKKIRKATLVRNSHMGWIVRFVDLVPKQKALEMALEIWRRERREEG